MSDAPIRFFPIDMKLAESVEPGGGVTVRMDGEETTLWFDLYGRQDAILQVFFANDCIVRILDEMALSTESAPERWAGLVPHHFAYRVEDDPFVDQQSETWRAVHEPFDHYVFHTDDSCVNILSQNQPYFALVLNAAVGDDKGHR